MSDDNDSENGRPSTESAAVEDSFEIVLKKRIKWAVSYVGNSLLTKQETVAVCAPGIPKMTWKFSFEEREYGAKVGFRYDCEVDKGGPAPMYTIRVSVLGGVESLWDKELHNSELRNNIYGSFLLGPMALNSFGRKDIPEINGMLVFEITLEFYLPYYDNFVASAGKVNLSNEIWNKEHRDSTKMRFLDMLETGDLSDFKIISSDGQEFHAHKFILKAGSEVFRAMFDNDMAESRSNMVNVDDMSAKAVRFLLHFIYSSELLPISKEEDSETATDVTLEEVLHLASKYQLKELTTHLDQTIVKFCDEENSVHLLKLCKLYSLQKGKEMILEFMMKKQGRLLKDLMFKSV